MRPATERQYRLVVRLFQQDRGCRTLDDVDTEHLAKWRLQVLDRASVSTWNNYRAHFRALWRMAMRLKWVEHDPFTMIKSVPTGQVRPRAVPVARIRRAMRLLESDPEAHSLQPRWFWHTVIYTLYSTGMRLRQLITLRWQDVDLDQKTITLTVEGSKTKREWMIPITDELRDAIRELLQHTYARLRRSPDPSDQVFNVTLFHPRYGGHRLNEDQVQGFFRRLSQHLGEHISCHRLRHTAGTELVRGPNPDFKAVQQLLGHTDLRMTLRYIHPDLDQLRCALTRLPQL